MLLKNKSLFQNKLQKTLKVQVSHEKSNNVLGNESVDSLFGMLRKYKRSQANVKEEIKKLDKVVLVKENEIITLDQTIAALIDTRANIAANAKRDKEVYVVKAQQNEAIIKRKDKLNVDL